MEEIDIDLGRFRDKMIFNDWSYMKKVTRLPESVYIVTGHFREYSSVILGIFYSESSASKFGDEMESTKKYDWIGWREYKVHDCSLKEKPGIVYLVIYRAYLNDPDVIGIFYSKQQAIEEDSKYASAYVRLEEYEIKK